ADYSSRRLVEQHRQNPPSGCRRRSNRPPSPRSADGGGTAASGPRCGWIPSPNLPSMRRCRRRRALPYFQGTWPGRRASQGGCLTDNPFFRIELPFLPVFRAKKKLPFQQIHCDRILNSNRLGSWFGNLRRLLAVNCEIDPGRLQHVISLHVDELVTDEVDL